MRHRRPTEHAHRPDTSQDSSRPSLLYTGALTVNLLHTSHAPTSHPRPDALPWLELQSSKTQPPRSTLTACAMLHANATGRYVPSRPFQQDLRQGHQSIRPIRENIGPIGETRADEPRACTMLTIDVHTYMYYPANH